MYCILYILSTGWGHCAPSVFISNDDSVHPNLCWKGMRVRFPIVSFEFFIEILSTALWSWGWIRNEYQEYFLGGKGGRCVRLATLQHSCHEYLEIFGPAPPGTLRACPRPVMGLLYLYLYKKGTTPLTVYTTITQSIRLLQRLTSCTWWYISNIVILGLILKLDFKSLLFSLSV
jgi:hypothetical protein